jgi:hypothetical protein
MFILNVTVKLLFFVVFLAVLYLVIDYFLILVQNNLNIPFLSLLSYLGVLQALQVLISMAISSYVVNQLISYFKS